MADGPWTKYQSQSTPADGPWTKYRNTAAPPPPASAPTLGQMFENGAVGFGKSLLNDVTSSDQWAREHLPAFMTNSDFGFGPPADLAKVRKMSTPQNAAQRVGFGVGDAAQFLIPGLGEDAAATKAAALFPKLGRAAAPLGRIAMSTLGTGAVNKLQGGGFGTGAALGLGAGAVGEGLKAAAPSIAETALHVGKRLRLPDRAVGRAVVNETHGITPEAVANSAADQIKARSKSSMNLVGRNTPFKMGRLPQRAQGLVNRVARKNANAINPGRELTDLFKTDPVTGNPIPSEMPFHQALDLRSRVGNFAPSTFSPDSNAAINPAAKGVYEMTTGALQRQFPQIKENDAVIHALIPARRAAKSTANNAGLFQRGMGRIAAHSGALASGIGAGILGYDQTHSLPDAIGAGIFGVGVPEAIASPTFQMMLARSAASRVPAAGLRTMFGGGMSTARQGRQR